MNSLPPASGVSTTKRLFKAGAKSRDMHRGAHNVALFRSNLCIAQDNANLTSMDRVPAVSRVRVTGRQRAKQGSNGEAPGDPTVPPKPCRHAFLLVGTPRRLIAGWPVFEFATARLPVPETTTAILGISKQIRNRCPFPRCLSNPLCYSAPQRLESSI